MVTKVLYAVLFGLIRLHALLPLQLLYLFSDVFYFFVYRVVRYRLSVVRSNMRRAFYYKNYADRVRMERKFYRHFADYVVETIKLAGMSEQELLRRAKINNPELIHELQSKGHTCIFLLMGHFGNWEWFSGASGHFHHKLKLNILYRPLKNKAFDRLFLYMRTRFHGVCLKKNDAAREILRIKRAGIPSLIIFIADQTPSPANLHYWTQFLNQESAVLTGPERIACKLDVPVVYCDMQQTRRGYYEINFQLVSECPAETAAFEITEKYIRSMEKTILRNPALWLWTHKRWKYRKQDVCV